VLQDQVEKLGKSNRNTLYLLDLKSTAHDRLAEELSTQQQKIIDLRREISILEERTQTAENTLSGAKFRESSLQQEVEILQRNNEWCQAELKTKAGEYSKFRKEKSARIAELQRLNEDATSTIESLQRTETTLRKRLEELGQKTEEAFARIHHMQEDGIRSEESFRTELDNASRLAELQKQSADTARRRVQELEDLLDQTKDDAAEEISQFQSELETERQGREATERKIEQLELHIEKLEVKVANQHYEASASSTPQPNGFGPARTPARGGSPKAFSPGSSSRARGGLSFTQLYTEYTEAKAELETEKRRNEKLSATIDEMLRDLEKKEPEIQELQDEHIRLEAEVASLSSMLATAAEEKDVLKRDGRRDKARAQGFERENALLEQQSRDLSAQIKVLLIEVQIREEGVNLTATERLQIHQAATGQGDEAVLGGMSDTARLISQRWVTFKSVFDLQDRNAELLRLTRELGERMEGEEARAKSNEQAQEKTELESLRDRVERYKDEIKSLVTQSQSYIRERDMFRRMLSHRGQIPPDADLESMFGKSINEAKAPQTPQRGVQTPTSRDSADYARLLKELQSHFDVYRQEAATNHTTLNSQIDQLAKEKGGLQGEIARASSQVTLAHERYEMLQANYNQLKTEGAEMQKRSQSLAEMAAKQDIRTQQVAEELIETKGLTESLRNENANLKAEKELWRRIEARLSEDNRSLVEEKSRTYKILTDTQNLFNERELSDSETRRRLQGQVESLEVELRTVKRKLEEETEETKKAGLRREYDQEQTRTRIDDLVQSLGNTKEELIAAKITRDHLQARVEELHSELTARTKRAQALQSQSLPHTSSSNLDHGSNVNTDAASHEEELGVEVAEIKRRLDSTTKELEEVRAHVEQYKAISQSSEEELQSLNELHDRYLEETERIVVEKDAKIRDLEERLQAISSELSTTKIQLSELRATAEDSTTRLSQQQATFEVEISRIKDESERYMETANFHQEDLKTQAEIAQRAQQNYEDELMKHAEAAQTLQKVRIEYQQVKLELSEAKADAEAARTTLGQNEESWSTTRDKYEKEMTELKNRRNDVDAQNKLLHQQLEKVGTQIFELQQRRIHVGENQESQTLADSGFQNLQEVIKFLRREKEIVDVQFELSVQEAKRFKHQLEYAQSQLDDARLKLDQERHQQADRERSSISHSKLMDTINELNVFRASSVTLRNEARQAQAQLAEKSKQVDDLIAQVQPLQTSNRELEIEREMSQGELKLIEEDRNRWQQRTQSILQKYDRIDPAELEALKEQITTQEREKEQLNAEKQTLQERVNGISEEIRKTQEEANKVFEEKRNKLVEQFKGRSRELSVKINDATRSSLATEAQKQSLEEQLEATKLELENMKKARDEAPTVARAESTVAQQASSQSKTVPPDDEEVQNGVEEGQIEENEGGDGRIAEHVLQSRLTAAEARAQGESQRAAQSEIETISLRGKIAELQSQVDELQEKIDGSNAEISRLQSQSHEVELVETSEPLETLKRDLENAKKEAHDLRAEASNKAQTNHDSSSGAQLGPDEIAAQVATIKAKLEREHTQKVEALEQQFKKRADDMRKQLSTKLSDGRAAIREELSKEHQSAMQRHTQEYEASVAQLNSDHQKELEETRKLLTAERSKQDEFNAKLSSSVDPGPAATENSFNEDSTINIKTEARAAPNGEWNPTDAQVQELIAKNQMARTILMKNINRKVEQETAKLKEQELKVLSDALEDARAKADKLKEQAVILEGKKWSAKFSMTEGRARTAMAKIEVVQKVATETPERPVAEVWAVAKDARAPSAQMQNQSGPPVSSPQAKSALSQSQRPVNNSSAVSTTAISPARQQQTPQPALVSNSEFGNFQGKTEGALPSPPQPQPSQANMPPKAPSSGTGPAALRGIMTQGSGIPRGGTNVLRGTGRGGQGDTMHSASTEQAQVSRLPQGSIARIQNERGGGLSVRGASRGRGRGGYSQSSATPPGGSPGRGRGDMNPGARQFVPGSKRPREDSTGGGDASDGKRIRGGAGGN